MLSRLALLTGRRPRASTFAVVLALVAALGSAIALGGSFKDDFSVPGIESQRAQDLLEQRFPAQSGTQATVVFAAPLDKPAITTALDRISEQPHVASVDKLRVSDDGKIAYATVGYDREASEIDGARGKLEEATTGLNAALSGEVIDGEATGGFPIGEVIGLAIAVIL